MKYPILFIAVGLLVSFVVSETLRSDLAFSYSSQNSNVNEGIRNRRTAASPAAVQPAVEHINYRPYSQVPSNIKQLLQFQQAREPINHIAAQAPPQLAKAATQARAQYNPSVQYGAQSQSQAQSHSQYQPQAQAQSHPQYQPQAQAQYQPQQSPIYRQNPQQNQPSVYNPQQQQQQQAHGNQQQVFRPDQRRLY